MIQFYCAKKRDFTLSMYEVLCKAIKKSGYSTLTVKEYLRSKPKKHFVIMRHDVDNKPDNSLAMARLENSLGITATYYFRTTDSVFKPDIVSKIAELGHEIGYHYEVLDRARGDYKIAIKMFKHDLARLRKAQDVTTICMHGNPLTKWDNTNLWKKYSFKRFGIIGEAYLSIDFDEIRYFTDTGRAWNGKCSVKDIVSAKNQYLEYVNGTCDLVALINKKEIEKMCIVTHPQRWNDPYMSWVKELVLQSLKNIGKMVINCLR